jgi:hypothetical protein
MGNHGAVLLVFADPQDLDGQLRPRLVAREFLNLSARVGIGSSVVDLLDFALSIDVRVVKRAA